MVGARCEGSESTLKRLRAGTDRTSELEATLERALLLMPRLGITRVANLTGLDRVGIPVVAVHRPNSRSVSVAQGKGASLLAAQVSGLMESIEGYHAEHIRLPLLLGSFGEMRRQHSTIDAVGLPRLSTSIFDPELPMLWVAGTELNEGTTTLVPYEIVHTDFRVPFPTGSGAFLMSSNGLASGNHMFEAISHAICELVERDANSLWHLRGVACNSSRRIDLSSVDEPTCRVLLEKLERAGLGVCIWETTSDIGIASFICILMERDQRAATLMQPIPGSGCHPRRSIALSRALTEAAQGRLTLISGSRDDLAVDRYDHDGSAQTLSEIRALLDTPGTRSFSQAPDFDAESVDADVQWELGRLRAAGLEQVIVVNLSQPDIGVPVVKVIVPYLEAMSEIVGYVPGERARRAMAGAL